MIKISFDIEESDLSGKHKFISRLKTELIKLNYKIVTTKEEADINLFTRKPCKHAKKRIYRLDGIWVNETQDYTTMNYNIIKNMNLSDGIIYQNEFCKRAVNKVLRIDPKRHACILNGAEPEEFRNSTFQNENKYFLAMCKWRPHKRLQSAIEGFLAANFKNIDLIVLGNSDFHIEHKNIKYLGWQNKESTNSILCNEKCIATVHLAWLDWCPNSAVESLVAGKQVLHANGGGTPYVVKGRGYAVKDKIWEWDIHNVYDPPKLDIDELAHLYIKSYLTPIIDFDISDLLISNIAKLYSEFFVKILGK